MTLPELDWAKPATKINDVLTALFDRIELDDGTPVDFSLLERALLNLPARLGDRGKLPGGSRISEAIGVLDRLTHADELHDFLTLPAYERLP